MVSINQKKRGFPAHRIGLAVGEQNGKTIYRIVLQKEMEGAGYIEVMHSDFTTEKEAMEFGCVINNFMNIMDMLMWHKKLSK